MSNLDKKTKTKTKIMKRIILLPILIMTLLIGSCKKEGCTDSLAENYNEKAKKDDGSCTYKADALIWWNEETSTALEDYESYVLYIYVDNVLVSTESIALFWNSAPECGAQGTVTASRDMKGNSKETVPYYIKDEYDEVLWDGYLEYEAGVCYSQQVEF